jgi:hypothetical protein
MSSHSSPVLAVEPRPSWLFWRPASKRLVRITWQQDGQWQLEFADRNVISATLCTHSWLHPWMMSLRWQLPDGSLVRELLWRGHYSHRLWHAWRVRLALEARTGKAVKVTVL